MAFGINSEPFLLAEGQLSIGTFLNPELVGTNGIDPESLFTGDNLGWFKQGTCNITIPREFAEFPAGTPSILVRKDLTKKMFGIEVELGQFSADILELAKGTKTKRNHAVTSPSSKVVDLMWMGSDEPIQPYYTWRLRTKLTSGRPLDLYIWHGKVTTDDIGLTLSGTEHATNKLKVEAFPHPNFDVFGADAQKHYGLWVFGPQAA